MRKVSETQVLQALSAFDLGGAAISAGAYGNGHINDTFLVKTPGRDYILQRINTDIFADPAGLMANITAVTAHLGQRIRARGGDPLRQTLTVVPTRRGEAFHRDENGCWRVYVFVTGSVTHETADTPAMLESAGRAFGAFVMDLGDFPAHTLHETIPDFHNTPARLRQLQDAIARDAAGRAKDVQPEIDAALAFAGETDALVHQLEAGVLPLRVTHNDTKLNNILFDAQTDQGMCVIDLDTVMPGLIAYDFGDAIRVGGNTTTEGDPDVSHVDVHLANFAAFTRGLLETVPDLLTDAEAASLVTGAKLMTWEVASRFLADHLNGDVYFHIHYPGQNLDRARNQIALVQAIHRHQAEMEAIVAEAWQRLRAR
ncbi:MAG: phosphotransferase enzyme family protein [Aristaeellaceae bacterium]